MWPYAGAWFGTSTVQPTAFWKAEEQSGTTSQRGAQHVAQRIEACVLEDKEEPPISVSIGMAVYPADGRTAQDLLEAADQLL